MTTRACLASHGRSRIFPPPAPWRPPRRPDERRRQQVLVLDLRGAALLPNPDEIRAIHRAPGLDFDQFMALSDRRDPASVAFVRIYNHDGSEAGACGNGARCVADRLARQTGADALTIETKAGLIACERLGPWSWRVDMGAPRLAWTNSAGGKSRRHAQGRYSPARRARLRSGERRQHGQSARGVLGEGRRRRPARTGRAAFRDASAVSQKANISFAQVRARDAIALRVWERGVGATLGCGSAACAALVAAARLALTGRAARIALPGGALTIEWRENDGHALMTGPVEFEREIELEFRAVRGGGERLRAGRRLRPAAAARKCPPCPLPPIASSSRSRRSPPSSATSRAIWRACAGRAPRPPRFGADLVAGAGTVPRRLSARGSRAQARLPGGLPRRLRERSRARPPTAARRCWSACPGSRTARSTTPWRCSTAGGSKRCASRSTCPITACSTRSGCSRPGPSPGPIVFRGVRIGVPICEDIWGPDPVECIAETGGEILLVPNASPYERDKLAIRHKVAVARVVESGLPLIYLNRSAARTNSCSRAPRSRSTPTARSPCSCRLSAPGRAHRLGARRQGLALRRGAARNASRRATRPITPPA